MLRKLFARTKLAWSTPITPPTPIPVTPPTPEPPTFPIVTALCGLGLTVTSAEARRLILGGGCYIDGVKITDPDAKIPQDCMVSAGRKHHARLDGDYAAKIIQRNRDRALMIGRGLHTQRNWR